MAQLSDHATHDAGHERAVQHHVLRQIPLAYIAKPNLYQSETADDFMAAYLDDRAGNVNGINPRNRSYSVAI
jgi:hypothetical protein